MKSSVISKLQNATSVYNIFKHLPQLQTVCLHKSFHVPCPINIFRILYLIEFLCFGSPCIIVKLRAVTL